MTHIELRRLATKLVEASRDTSYSSRTVEDWVVRLNQTTEAEGLNLIRLEQRVDEFIAGYAVKG